MTLLKVDKICYHILNGNVLQQQLSNLSGRVIIAKECLVEGDVTGETLDEFWQKRASFLCPNNPKSYFEKSVKEFDKVTQIDEGSEVNLWFEYDLFCQVNLWFCCWLLRDKTLKTYLVTPSKEVGWLGFGGMDAPGLKQSLENRMSLSFEDIGFFSHCWEAFKSHDLESLVSYGESDKFPFLRRVIQAHLERFDGNGIGRPERAIKSIIDEKQTDDFGIIFREFSKREGIYGFGDLQVKRILDRMS